MVANCESSEIFYNCTIEKTQCITRIEVLNFVNSKTYEEKSKNCSVKNNKIKEQVMKFVVSRTSDREYEHIPCKKAVLETVIYIDERSVNSLKKYHILNYKWYGEGTNHRVEKGHIKRDFFKKDMLLILILFIRLNTVCKKTTWKNYLYKREHPIIFQKWKFMMISRE